MTPARGSAGPGGGWLRVASDRALRLLIIAAGVAVLVYGAAVLRVVVLPVFLAVVLSTALEPLVRRLADRGVPSGLAAGIVVLGALVAFFGSLAAIVPPTVAEVDDLEFGISGGIDVLQRWASQGAFGVSGDQVGNLVDRAQSELASNAGQLTSGVLTGAVLAVEILIGLALAIVLLFFFLADGTAIWRWLVDLAPTRYRHDVDAVGQRARTALGGYLRGVTIVALFDAVFIAIALLLIGVPLVLPLAVLTFVGAFIPIVGAVVAGLAAALVALVAVGPVAALATVGATVLVQQLEGNVLQPVVVGRSVQLHPVVILLAVTAGGVLAGIVGALIAAPIAAVGGAALRYLRFERDAESADAEPRETEPAPAMPPAAESSA